MVKLSSAIVYCDSIMIYYVCMHNAFSVFSCLEMETSLLSFLLLDFWKEFFRYEATDGMLL